MLQGKTLHLNSSAGEQTIVATLKALGSAPRWRILQVLADGASTVNELAEQLGMPPSTIAAHIRILEEVGLVHTELQAASHGLQKVCTRTYDNVSVILPPLTFDSTNYVEIVMPIGAYTRAEVEPTCGLASPTGLISYIDDPISFYEPERLQAGLLWFRSGFVEYQFPKRLPAGVQLKGLQLSMELCSEAPLHNHNWPSDITLWINDHEIGTWTCPGDFGGTRGQLTPEWWSSSDSQYGLLKRWSITQEGAFMDGRPLSRVTIGDLELDCHRAITVRIGVKPDAVHVGGLNLFGHTFGNYPQDLVLRLEYVPSRSSSDNGALRRSVSEESILVDPGS